MDELKTFREEINEVDDALICLLGERMEIIRNVGSYKKKNNLPVLNTERFKKILKSLTEKGKDYGLPQNMIKELYEVIHEYSVKEQEKAN
ncbi:hypothetical protein A2331_01130 [Candidatus Falkowbacteria bacterium RIFOXYB2_FULL_34_18]|uniref:Chorismate mutase domain-containing protein n=1 Tax=Candidatus Falkowbacteria bacterium RIFOXYD2_FULL_34_120 TaxID=1798007 RepID=A0A1F5TPQ4_9BACT|nr:MAG: hypothetical protein A2331_01130 [Candidatus Falkowbacteria bacterium RIFOXYB2_FULL_34_18]OGF29118.1 MAG: hypothetical protein A2500_02740 [Candidatus Falkowbacteria bacterium RIFOXYC12_FULL_34_55]OGF36214.1 MAG: hypothetical protein A2466_04910 [Candidatus Falkowbacteria bacterium RIFOXYC2_FULL_34_220]OGF38628.1 MAG: hypothetical protein A2515_06870 [Candidatus Falkowbacteria bacterium RIFOXYD12_FULL_34_57]OGF40817.1 MAG: hypothetical protein A2531_06575 [Candidatus Falkowbacteria bact